MYAICFDFPELNGDPVFAGWTGSNPKQLGFAPKLETAAKWDSEEVAGNFLRNNWGEKISQYGTVVEVEP